MDVNKILEDREIKAKQIDQYIKDYQVVSLKSNIPGPCKNLYMSYILINIYNNMYIKKLNPIKTIYIDSYDGPYFLYLFDKKEVLKDKLIEIETNTYLGRFIDLDCFYESNISLHRNNPRKCFICNKDAFVCNRENNHSLDEKLSFIEDHLRNYLIDNISALIKSSSKEELDLTIKFGLVSPLTSGSHKDMDYMLMKNSIDTITPYLTNMFIEGYDYKDSNLTILFNSVRKIGIKADEAMFKQTNNINTYQGLIFNLGLVVTSLGYCLKHNLKYLDIFEVSKKMVESLAVNKGAINEARNGYINVINIINNYSLDNDTNKRFALMDLIINVEDTIFSKRCPSLESRIILKDRFKEALFSKDNRLINQINEYCEKNNYSFGGCADLLIVAIFVKRISYLFNINK